MLEPIVAPAPKMATRKLAKNATASACRVSQHTSVAHFLPELLPIRTQLALLRRHPTASALTDIQRHITIARLRWWRRPMMSESTFLFHDSHVASRKDAFQTCALILSLGPIGIHEFCDDDAIVG